MRTSLILSCLVVSLPVLAWADDAGTGKPAKAAAAAKTAPAADKTDQPADAADKGTESAHLAVVELKLAEDIKDREAVNPGTSFANGAKVYAWVKLNVKEAETQFKLRWSSGDLTYTSEPVTVKESPGYRSWRYKTAEAPGEWKVEVLDADDKVVHSETFTVK